MMGAFSLRTRHHHPSKPGTGRSNALQATTATRNRWLGDAEDSGIRVVRPGCGEFRLALAGVPASLDRALPFALALVDAPTVDGVVVGLARAATGDEDSDVRQFAVEALTERAESA